MMEEYLRRAMLMSRGDPTVFLSRPISCVILIVAAAALVAALIPTIRNKREEAFQE
jgi:TctA family transporter